MAGKKKTPAQQEAARKADAKRYAKDKTKRIAAQKAQDAKEKRENPAAYKAKQRAHDTAPPMPKGKKCTYPGCNRPATEWHETSYNPIRRTARCSIHNPKGMETR